MMWLARLVGGPVVDAVVGVFRQVSGSQGMTEAEIRGEVEKAVLGTISRGHGAESRCDHV